MHGGCWWALALAVVAPVVAATPAAAETGIEVDAGYGGRFIPGRDVPVRVRISADRLVRGSLEVAVGNTDNAVPVAMAVEVPGGSEKEFVVIVTSGLHQNPDVTARLHQGGGLVAAGQSTVRAAGDTELVGVMPAAARGRTLPGAAPLAVDAGTARFVPVAEAELALAPASLGPLSTVAADVDDIVRLTPQARAGVLRWVDDGGRLLVDTAKGDPVPGLPDEWQPGPRGRAAAGLGEVVATDGAIAAGRWPGLVEPSGQGVALNDGRFGGDMSLAGSLASDAGLRTPELGWLVAFLVVYVVAVGPVLFFAVRRRGRPELAWVAVPLVALLFATGSYVVGRDLRKATQLVHATVLSSGRSGPRASTYVGVFSRGGETANIGFPTGWSSGGFPSAGQPVPIPTLVTTTQEGPDTRLPLDAGQFGVVHGQGPAPDAGGLTITARGEPSGRISGTVRNATAFRLEEVLVLAGADGVLVGSIGPAEERPFAVANAGQFRPDGGAEFRFWTGPMSDRRAVSEKMALWQAALRDGGSNYRAPGVVVAAGFTSDFSPALRVGRGSARPEGRTVVVGRQRVDAAPDAPLELAARREVVRDPFAGPGGMRGGGGSVLRFVLPDGVDTSRLVLRGHFPSAEVWRDGGWQAVTCQGPNCRFAGNVGVEVACPPNVPCRPPPPMARGGPGNLEFTVAPGAVRDGVVYVRVPMSASFDMGQAITLGRSA